jgi:uncharacterized protein YggE
MNRFIAPFLLGVALVAPATAGAQSQGAQTPRIVVSGEGEAAIAPDMAILTLAVMREAETAREALDANNEAMAAVLAAMKEAGIADRDLQTTGLQINPQYHYPQSGGEQPRITGYQVSNTLTVRVRDIDALGAIIDRSVTLGVNQGGGISFTNDDPSATLTEARKRAVADAVARARTLAEAAGVELGGIIEMSEQTSNQPPMPITAKAFRAEADAVPVAAGENAYRVQVNVTFEIAR